MSTWNDREALLVLPARSRALAFTVCAPSGSVSAVWPPEKAAVATPEVSSFAERLRVGAVRYQPLVPSAAGARISRSGGVESLPSVPVKTAGLPARSSADAPVLKTPSAEIVSEVPPASKAKTSNPLVSSPAVNVSVGERLRYQPPSPSGAALLVTFSQGAVRSNCQLMLDIALVSP